MNQIGKRSFNWKWVFLVLGAGLLALVAFSTIHRSADDLSRLVPAGVLCYVEVESLEAIAQELAETRVWTEVAPLFGYSGDLAGLEKLATDARLSDLNLTTLDLVRTTRFALAVTGFEADATELKPALALLVRPGLTLIDLDNWLRKAIGSLAAKEFGAWSEETMTVAGQSVRLLRNDGSPRTLAWCSLDGVFVVANGLEPIRLIIETQLGQRRSLVESPGFDRLRRARRADAPVFGYVDTQAEDSAILQLGSLSDSSTIRDVQPLLEGILSAFAVTLSYEFTVEAGLIAERYRVPGGEEFLSQLGQAVTRQSPQLRSARLIPQTSRSFTIIRGDIEQAVSVIDTAVSQHLPLVSKMAIDGVVNRLKGSLGLKAQDTLADTIGDEMALVERDGEDLLYILHTKRKAKLASLIGKYLQRDGARVRTSNYAGHEIFSSSLPTRASACFIDDLVLIGPLDLIDWALEATDRGATIERTPAIIDLIDQKGRGAIEVSVRLSHDREIETLASLLQRLSPDTLSIERLRERLSSLPPTVRATWLSSEGLISETWSVMGEVPFWLLQPQ